MTSQLESGPERLRVAAQVYFAIVGGIGLLTGVFLLAAPGTTAEYFAWPIAPPQTALFMGAGYLGTGITLFILLLLGRFWRDVWLIFPPIVVFASSMIGATLLHADRFLWDRAVTWIWLSLYGVIVLGAGLLSYVHRGRRQTPRADQLTLGERRTLFVVGLATAAWSLPLYFVPSLAPTIWPWTLTPLTARVIAGWVAVAATLALVGGWGNDARSLRLPLVGWTVTVIAFLAASAFGVPASLEPRVLIYFASLAFSVAGSLWLLVRIRRRVTV